MRVRQATESDAPWIVYHCAGYARANGFDIPDDPEVAGDIMLGWIKHHYVRIVEDGPKPLGFCVAWKGMHPFNPKL